eukprot:g857.t1
MQSLSLRRHGLRSPQKLLRSFSSSVLGGTNGVYFDEMYRSWKADPSSVHVSWDAYFKSVESGVDPAQAFTPPPGLETSTSGRTMGATPLQSTLSSANPNLGAAVRLRDLVRAYQVRGHEVAQLDPLELSVADTSDKPELNPMNYGFEDMNQEFDLNSMGFDSRVAGFLSTTSDGPSKFTLAQVHEKLKAVYCGTIGYDYMHIPNRDECNWLREKIEVIHKPLEKKEAIQVLDRLAYSTMFEGFLATKFGKVKRFGIDGCDAMVPGMKTMIDTVSEHGVHNVTIGMPHRGRLNVLVNVMRKPMDVVFKEFVGANVDTDEYMEQDHLDWSASGDVKYHMGISHTRAYGNGHAVHLSLLPNPSHLEAVNPLALGKTRAKMSDRDDVDGDQNLSVLIHGDAAFAGQGVVYETMQFAKLKDYSVAGTIHIICNNQIGYTTMPSCSRSTRYASDLGKTFDCPIFHVNADDPEAVVRAFKIASEFRMEFKRDVIIDLIGYRRFGHNEGDEPSFTQPLMYQAIKKHSSSLDLYKNKLMATGVLTKEEVDEIIGKVRKTFEEEFEKSKLPGVPAIDFGDGNWSSLSQEVKVVDTGVPRSLLEEIGQKLTAWPSDFQLHNRIKRIMKEKEENLANGTNLDWGTAEALAFGTLLQQEKHNVRLSGQDCERGTFSHRHAVVHCQASGEEFRPLAHLVPGPRFEVCNSPLSEYGVMGFEMGYSMERPDNLVLWEAQFGDFVNGAQIILDQFLSSAETKWHRQSGLTVLLPHGYEGQGPEHSSCRYERYLQMVDEDPDDIVMVDSDNHDLLSEHQVKRTNWQIVNCSTPANYFHVLRRQQLREFRKPLIVISPKYLLRYKDCVSSFDDMAEGTRFQPVMSELEPETLDDPKDIRRIILCTGKVYYNLLEKRRAEGIKDVAIVRIEQIAPFPFHQVAAEIDKYSPEVETVWVQEEPKNMGAWYFVQDRIMTATNRLLGREVRPGYVGRSTESSPAVGYGSVHNAEQEKLLNTAFSDKVDAYGHGYDDKIE